MIEETIWCMFPTYPCIGYLSVFHDMSQQGDHTSTLKVLNSVQELFKEQTSGSWYPKRVLIEGHTGIGKTTVCKEICYQWAENNLLTPDELVLLLLLQDPNAQKITSERRLAEYFTTSVNFIEPFNEYLINSCGTGITIVVDSYDQLSEDLQENGFIKDLIKGNRLPKAQVIVTSTPFVSYCLHEYVDRRVEIFELVKSIRNKFIAAALKEYPVTFDMLQKHFQKYPEIDMLSCIPINMAILVCLCQINIFASDDDPDDDPMDELLHIYNKVLSMCATYDDSNDDPDGDTDDTDDTDDDEEHDPFNELLRIITPMLPCNAAELYEAFCKSVMKMMCSFVLHVQKKKQDEIPCNENKSMWFTLNHKARKRLQYSAYEALIKNKLIFLENDLYDMCREYPTCYGLMQSIECYSSAHHNKRVLFNFLCPGIHWYLAARYVRGLNNTHKILENCLATQTDSLFHLMPIDWSMQVLKMCIMAFKISAKIKLDNFGEIRKILDNDFDSYNIHSYKLKFSHNIPCIYAVQSHLIAMGHIDSGYISLYTSPLIDYVPIMSPKQNKVETLDTPVMVDTPVTLDSPVIVGTPVPVYSSITTDTPIEVNTLITEDTPFCKLCVFQLFPPEQSEFEGIVKNGSIDLSYYYLLPYHIVSLGLFLTETKETVNELHLTGCSIGDYGLYLLHKYVCSKKHTPLDTMKLTATSSTLIDVINLNRNNLTAASSILLNILIDHVKPHSLKLNYNNLTDTGVAKLHTAVIRNNMQELHLVDNALTTQGSKFIALMMETIKQLDISCNNINDDGTKMLSQGILHTVTLKCLHINDCNIGAVGTGELARALKINTSLEALWMNGNAIGHSGATDIAVALRNNNTLKELSLTGDATIDYAAASKLLASFKENTTVTKLRLPTSTPNKLSIENTLLAINSHREDDNHELLSISFQELLLLKYLTVHS